MVDALGSVWPWNQNQPENTGITVEELSMSEDDWQVYLDDLHKQEAERVEKNLAKREMSEREEKYSQYLKLKKEFEQS